MDTTQNVQTRMRAVTLKTSPGMRRHIRQEKAKIRREVFDQQEIRKRFQMLYESFVASPRESAPKADKPRKNAARPREAASKVKPIDKITNSGIKSDSGKSKTAGK